MAKNQYATPSAPVSFVQLGGGLNSTSGPLGLQENESTDLQNIDFDKFGSILQRNGYTALNTSAITNTPNSDGLYWYVYDDGTGTTIEKLINVTDGKLYKMDALDGTWDNVTETQAVVFTGSGLDDGTSSGTYTGNGDIEYKVVIDLAAATDTFEWFKDNVSQASGVSITGAAQLLDNGLSITFVATTGHTLNDQWVFHPATVITADNHCDFETYINTVLITNNVNPPFQWDGTGNSALMTVPPGLTKARAVSQFQNYTFLANVLVSGVAYPSRFYWSEIRTIDSWDAADWIEVAKEDGQEITAIKVLGDRLIVYKERSIHVVAFTGDRTTPFLVYKTNSPVGCIAPFSIQELDNGHIFLTYDGIYFFDGNNSFKVSDRITTTLLGLNRTKLDEAVSLYQRDKNRYWLSVASSGSGTNDTIIVWDAANNAFSKYNGINASGMADVIKDKVEERPYFADYLGFVYRGDTGIDDYPSNSVTAIDSYYATNWKNFVDVVNQKRIPHIYTYYEIANTVLTLSYAYDFDTGEERSLTIDLSTSGDVYNTAVYGDSEYSVSGGRVTRNDLTGRGRVIRFKYSNNIVGETWQVDGFGVQGGLETNF